MTVECPDGGAVEDMLGNHDVTIIAVGWIVAKV